MRVAFFGASVTAQSKGTGYYDYLSEQCRSQCIETARFAHSASHFDDAGFYRVDDVISYGSDFCVFEWNTTKLDKFSNLKFDEVMRRFAEKRVIPLFLILPRIDTNIGADRDCERFIKIYAEQYNLPLLDLRGRINPELCLRDQVHTNLFGAKLYSDHIAAWIFDLVSSGCTYEKFIIENESKNSLNCSRIILEKPTEFLNRLNIVGRMGCDNLNEICIETIIGPWSPVIEHGFEGEKKRKFSLWDPWCHYEREMLISLTKDLKKPQSNLSRFCYSLELNSNAPDYTKCRKAGFSYEGCRKVVALGFHYTGFHIESQDIRFDT